MRRFIGNLINKFLEWSFQRQEDKFMRQAYEDRQKSLKRKCK